jgi:hypothetical protein
MATAADRPVSLPTGRLLVAACVPALLTGMAWSGVTAVSGKGETIVVAGMLAGAIVAACSMLSVLLIQPWRPRPLYRWPMVWIGGSFLRLLVTLGLTFLLYSATPYGTVSLWLAVVAAYAATLFGETRAYATYMKQYSPAPGSTGPAADPSE